MWMYMCFLAEKMCMCIWRARMVGLWLQLLVIAIPFVFLISHLVLCFRKDIRFIHIYT